MFPGRVHPAVAPALIRLITVHTAARRARPPLSHGREESPSVRARTERRFSLPPLGVGPEARCHPFLSRLLLSCPLSLCQAVSGVCLPTISDSFSLCLLCLSFSSSLSTLRPSISVSLSPASLLWSEFNLLAHYGTPGRAVHLRPSLLSLGTPGSWHLLNEGCSGPEPCVFHGLGEKLGLCRTGGSSKTVRST